MGHEAKTLDAFLNDYVFNDKIGSTIDPSLEDVQGFAEFMERYAAALRIERTAVDYLK
jgi:L-ribulokinase